MDPAMVRSWLNDLSPSGVSNDIASMDPNETQHPHPHGAADSQALLSRMSTSEPSSTTDSERHVLPFRGFPDLSFCQFRTVLPPDCVAKPTDETMYGMMDETMDKLLHKIIDISKGQGIVPASVKPCIDQLHWRTKNQFRSDNYTSAEVESPSREDQNEYESLTSSDVESISFEDRHEYERLLRIFSTSREYTAESLINRTDWNFQVVLPVLVLLRKHWFTETNSTPFMPYEWHRDLIDKTTLIHMHGIADYVITLKEPTNILEALRGIDKRFPMSANHATEGELLRRKPICVSIAVVNPNDSGGAIAKARLVVWGAAYMEHLVRVRRHIRSKASGERPKDQERTASSYIGLPTLPMVFVDWERWDLYFLKMNSDGKVFMIVGEELGNTSSLLGAYRLLRSLQAVVDSATEEFELWWADLLAELGTQDAFTDFAP